MWGRQISRTLGLFKYSPQLAGSSARKGMNLGVLKETTRDGFSISHSLNNTQGSEVAIAIDLPAAPARTPST